MRQKKNHPQKYKSPLQNDILNYGPLVKKIALYFHQINSYAELEDLIQEGWHGLLMAVKKYDPSKGVSLGAYATRYIFGRIYRSLLGTKNLQHNKKMVLLESSENIIDKKSETNEMPAMIYDHICNKYSADEAMILKMIFSNYKKCEIIRQMKITSEFYDNLLEDFKNNF